MPGPQRIPTVIKKLQGNPGKRKLNLKEPKPEPGIPKCPAWLNKKGKVVWKELSTLLSNMRVLTVADRYSLALLCDIFSEYIETRKFLHHHGSTYELKTKNGEIMFRNRPEVTKSAELFKRVISLMRDFGLTPSSRSGISIEPDPEGDSFLRFLKQREKF